MQSPADVGGKYVRLSREAAGSGHDRHDESHEGLSRRDRVGTGIDEGHQPADLPSQADPLGEGDQTDQAAEGGDRLGGGGELDLSAGKDRVKGYVHRLVKGCGVRLVCTTLLPLGLTPNDAFSNFRLRVNS